MHARTDPSTDAASTGRWCTYDEAATLLGITRGGARNLARKRSWARRPGNDGKARILVPADAVPASTDAPIDPGTDARTDAAPEPAPDAATELRVMVARLEGELAGLRVVIEAERRRADLAESLVADLRQDRDRGTAERERHAVEVKRLEDILGAERARVDELLKRRTPAVPVVPAQQRRGWWPWRRSA